LLFEQNCYSGAGYHSCYKALFSTICSITKSFRNKVSTLWKTKFEHSQHRPTNSIFIITQKGDKLRLTRYQIYGEKKNKLKFRMIADSKTIFYAIPWRILMKNDW